MPLKKEGEAEKVDTFASTLFNIATFPIRLVGKAIQGVVFVITEGAKAILGTPGKIIRLVKRPFQSEKEIISVGFKKIAEVPKTVTPSVEVEEAPKSLVTRAKEIVMTKEAAEVLLAGVVVVAAVAVYAFYTPEEISPIIKPISEQIVEPVAHVIRSVSSEGLVALLQDIGVVSREVVQGVGFVEGDVLPVAWQFSA